MTLYPDLDQLPLDELEKRLRDVAPVHPQYATSYFDEVAARIRETGVDGVLFLLDQVKTDDVNRRRAIVSTLGFPGLKGAIRQRVLEVLRESLADVDPFIVQDAVDGLALLRDRSVIDQILSLRDHPSAHVRGSVLRYLAKVDPEDAPGALMAALADPDPIARESAIDLLDELGVIPAIYQIRKLTNDPNPAVREAAEAASRNLEELQHSGPPPINGLAELGNGEKDWTAGPAEFKRFCHSTLLSSGYSSLPAETLYIPGLDLLARDLQQQLIAVQCKWTHKVTGSIGESPVINLRASTDAIRADRGILMTNGRVSRSATVLAWSTSIELLDSTTSRDQGLREGWKHYLTRKRPASAPLMARQGASQIESVVVSLRGMTPTVESVAAVFEVLQNDKVVELEVQYGGTRSVRTQLDALAERQGFKLRWAAGGRNRAVVYRAPRRPS